MLPDRVSNPGPLTYESGALPIALRGPATHRQKLPTDGENKRFSLKVFDSRANYPILFLLFLYK